MALRDKMRTNAAPFAPPGEPIQAVIGAQTRSQYWILVAFIVFFLLNDFRMIVVTPQRIVVLDCGKWRLTKPKAVLAQFPRDLPLGPPTGTIWHKVQVGNETLRIHRRFWKDIAAAA